MDRLLLLLLVSVFFFEGAVAAEIDYEISSSPIKNFFAYHRSSGTVEFYEESYIRQPTGGYDIHSSTNYYLNLKDKEVVRVRRGRELLSGCFGGELIRRPHGRSTASLNNNTNTLSLLDLETGECRHTDYNYATMAISWSDDGKWLELMDRKSVAFYRMNPETMKFEKLERKGAIDSMAWSPKLGRSLYVYRTKPVGDNYESSADYAYYYVDDDGVQRKVEDTHPMTNPNGDVYFYTEFLDEEPPTTTFVDVKTGKELARQPAFYLAISSRYAIWLKDNWVYFEGGGGVLNYRTGEFVSLGTELTPSVSPFSVSDGRYAMMYLRGEDRLMVYDLEERKYIESYEPFWRESN